MTSKSRAQLAPLPWIEILAYWVLSFGSHLYSFYQLHRFSKEHEAGLERELQLEKGLLKDFKRDSSDFEWSFWTEWAKRSLLWTLIGHGVISRFTSVFYPKFRVPALTTYGLVVASSVLGIKGVSVLLVHLGVSFSVAQLRKPALSWACNLLLLCTLHIQPLQEIQRGWYKTEEEYYLLLFSVAVCGLRFISFSLEHCWCPQDRDGLVELFWLFSYTFYHPFFYNGPIITYTDYIEKMRGLPKESDREDSGFCHLLLRSGRIILWWCIAEYMIHVMYMHSIQSNETYIEILPPWALGFSWFYNSQLTWHFDEGLYRWLIRYIYVPLGGSQHGPLYKMLSTGLAFGFVCLWHGGHDYLQYWALMNWAGVLMENGLKSLFTSTFIHSIIEQKFSAAMKRRCIAFLSAFSTAMLILSNLVFLGGIHVGRIFWKRVFIQGWSSMAPPMLAFLYCFAQIGLEWTSHPT
ncbi:protein-cysteine N-palmitoyltransferase HHAT isoform X2 [Mastacembelus armatus]|uniref:protein-cysteine N-palmitoyltransferase HHAT isoform X2 n=1 Tax=Mastacembelus armatus TaxID=205130 RepID=UPI000E459117|nr:protein-cysteine N-palmitoyltransferase HHAT isoform X2 [Mastacembelus armatus]